MDDEYRRVERLAVQGDVFAVNRLRVLRQRQGIGKTYSVVSGSSYADGLWNLRDRFVNDLVVDHSLIKIGGESLVRSLSLKESLVARVNDF